VEEIPKAKSFSRFLEHAFKVRAIYSEFYVKSISYMLLADFLGFERNSVT